MLSYQQKMIFKKIQENFISNVTIYYFILVFLYTLSAFILIVFWVLPNTTGSIGDPDVYRDLARENLLAIRLHGWRLFQVRPGGQGPAGVTSLLLLVFDSEFIVILFNSLIHTLSVFILFRLIRRAFSRQISLLASLPLALSPFMVIWYSQISKESIMLIGALLLVKGFGEFPFFQKDIIRKSRFLYPALEIITGALLISLMRPYVNQIILPFAVIIFTANDIYNFFLCKKNLFTSIFVAGVLIITLILTSFGAQSDSTLTRIGNSKSELLAQSGQSALADECIAKLSQFDWTQDALASSLLTQKLRALMGQRCLIFTGYGPGAHPNALRSYFDTEILPSTNYEALIYLPKAIFMGWAMPTPYYWKNIFKS